MDENATVVEDASALTALRDRPPWQLHDRLLSFSPIQPVATVAVTVRSAKTMNASGKVELHVCVADQAVAYRLAW